MYFSILKTFFACGLALNLSTLAHAEIIAEAGGVSVDFISHPPLFEGGLARGVVRLVASEGARLATFTRVQATNTHHVGLRGLFIHFNSPTISHWESIPSPPDSWIAADSHLLIRLEEVGGGAGGGFGSLFDTSDESGDFAEAIGQFGTLPLSANTTGIGSISSWHPTDAFFLKQEFQQNELDFAYLVGIPGTTSRVTFDVLGAGFENCDAGQGACFDFELLWSVPEPGSGVLFGLFAVMLSRKRKSRLQATD